MTRDELKDEIHDQYGSYGALGREIGVSPQAISEIVNGRTTSATARYSVARALGLEVEDVWPEEARTA